LYDYFFFSGEKTPDHARVSDTEFSSAPNLMTMRRVARFAGLPKAGL
jgi:hypothetical protein